MRTYKTAPLAVVRFTNKTTQKIYSHINQRLEVAVEERDVTRQRLLRSILKWMETEYTGRRAPLDRRGL